MGVYHPQNPQLVVGKGVAKKKGQAEQLASKEALLYFDKNPPMYEEKTSDNFFKPTDNYSDNDDSYSSDEFYEDG